MPRTAGEAWKKLRQERVDGMVRRRTAGSVPFEALEKARQEKARLEQEAQLRKQREEARAARLLQMEKEQEARQKLEARFGNLPPTAVVYRHLGETKVIKVPTIYMKRYHERIMSIYSSRAQKGFDVERELRKLKVEIAQDVKESAFMRRETIGPQEYEALNVMIDGLIEEQEIRIRRKNL